MLIRLNISYMIFCVVFLLTSCDKLEYNPNQKFDRDTPQNINAVNISRIIEKPADDTVRFILSGDTQRGYDEARGFVKKANAIPGVDFVVIAGDISDFGLLQEMEWMVGILNDLKAPYIGVIGNHDLTANGKHVFQNVFGDLNYSFTYKGIKFISINTNSREVNFDGTVPDIGWLQQQVRPETEVGNIVAISHVSPQSVDFDKKLQQPFISALSGTGKCLASMHAHDHTAKYTYERGIPFIIAGAILKREFALITIINGRLENEFIEY